MSKPSLPTFAFTHDSSCGAFTKSSKEYFATQPKQPYEYLATGALVFFNEDTSSQPRILLIQRAATDSMPNRWEIPGGGVDDDDESILHAVARELWEEAGLVTVNIGPLVGDAHVFQSRSGKRVCKLSFLVEAKGENGKMEVKLDPEEHQDSVSATEDEVKAGQAGDVELVITTQEQKATILEAFRVRKAS